MGEWHQTIAGRYRLRSCPSQKVKGMLSEIGLKTINPPQASRPRLPRVSQAKPLSFTNVIYSHFVITRLNINNYKRRAMRHLWTEERLKLMREFTMASLQNQTCKNFVWLILHDPETRQLHLDEIASWPLNICLIPMGNSNTHNKIADPGAVRNMIMQEKAKDATHVICSMLDSDDAIHRDYIADVQATRPTKLKQLALFPIELHLRLRDMTYVLARSSANAFISLIQAIDGRLDVPYTIHHHQMPKRYPTVILRRNTPMLLITHHEFNAVGHQVDSSQNDVKKHKVEALGERHSVHLAELQRDFGVQIEVSE